MSKQKTYLENVLSGEWILYLLSSILLIIFGILTLVMPGMTLAVGILYISVFLFLWGILYIAKGIVGGKNNSTTNRILMVLGGILMLVLGVIVAKNPDMTFVTLALLAGWALIIVGIIDLAIGIFSDSDSDDSDNRIFYIVMGVIGVLAGIVTLFYPVSSSLIFLWVIGLYALIAGAVELARTLEVHHDYKKFVKNLDKSSNNKSSNK